jgi:hypothetical protein
MEMNLPYDAKGNLLQVGDKVRGLPKTSHQVEEGIVDEIRPTNTLNVRFLVGELKKHPNGVVLSGWHYSESQFLEKVEPTEPKPAAAEKSAVIS